MKYFTFIVFLFSAIILNAQMSMEEISFIPSRSGYYNNLVVKGNVKIKELNTHPFNIVTYGSYLKLNLSDSSYMYTNIFISTGTAVLYSEFNVDEVADWTIDVPNAEPQRTNSTTTLPIPLNMNGGSLSVSRSGTNASLLKIDPISFQASEAKTPTLNIRTENLQIAENAIPIANNLYILGMKIPGLDSSADINKRCLNGYYWQPVKAVNGTTYTILACNMTTCSNPSGEENCLHQPGRFWDTTNAPNCECNTGEQSGQWGNNN